MLNNLTVIEGNLFGSGKQIIKGLESLWSLQWFWKSNSMGTVDGPVDTTEKFRRQRFTRSRFLFCPCQNCFNLCTPFSVLSLLGHNYEIISKQSYICFVLIKSHIDSFSPASKNNKVKHLQRIKIHFVLKQPWNPRKDFTSACSFTPTGTFRTLWLM